MKVFGSGLLLRIAILSFFSNPPPHVHFDSANIPQMRKMHAPIHYRLRIESLVMHENARILSQRRGRFWGRKNGEVGGALS
jgi:hypothetical protein